MSASCTHAAVQYPPRTACPPASRAHVPRIARRLPLPAPIRAAGPAAALAAAAVVRVRGVHVGRAARTLRRDELIPLPQFDERPAVAPAARRIQRVHAAAAGGASFGAIRAHCDTILHPTTGGANSSRIRSCRSPSCWRLWRDHAATCCSRPRWAAGRSSTTSCRCSPPSSKWRRRRPRACRRARRGEQRADGRAPPRRFRRLLLCRFRDVYDRQPPVAPWSAALTIVRAMRRGPPQAPPPAASSRRCASSPTGRAAAPARMARG